MADDLPFPVDDCRPRKIPLADGSPSDPHRPVNYPIFEEREHFLATVHGFDAGGFEATIRCVDLQAMVDAKLRPRGYRKPVEERNERDMLRAVARAKKTSRHATKTIGASHLMTLTTRKDENSPETLARQWKRFVRAYRVYVKDEFPYVAVPERHPRNPKHWHLHISPFVGSSSSMWLDSCGGRAVVVAEMGNVDAQHIKVGVHPDGTPKGPLVKAEKIARYLSK